MRVLSLFLVLAFTFCGCASAPRPDPSLPSAPPGDEASRVITPLLQTSGRVVSVNPALRFVVVDFFLAPLPPLEQRMHLYREDRKVGEIRISGPARHGAIAADILEGEAAPGDEVRWE